MLRTIVLQAAEADRRPGRQRQTRREASQETEIASLQKKKKGVKRQAHASTAD
jgi:hypothetical protein